MADASHDTNAAAAAWHPHGAGMLRPGSRLETLVASLERLERRFRAERDAERPAD